MKTVDFSETIEACDLKVGLILHTPGPEIRLDIHIVW